MSAIRGIISSAAKLFKRLRGMSREEIIARCDSLRRRLEMRGMSLLKQADRFHAEAVMFAKRRMLRAAKARLEVWAEYKSEAESCIIMASLYDRIKLRVIRAASLEEITRISDTITTHFDKLLQTLPNDPVSARYVLEGTIDTLDNMLAHYVGEDTYSPEAEEEFRRIMSGEVEEVPIGEPLPSDITAPTPKKVKTKKEEVAEELKRIAMAVGM